MLCRPSMIFRSLRIFRSSRSFRLQLSFPAPATMSKLPDVIKIDDIASGKIDPEDIYAELDRLKAEINILRNDMAQFVRALAFIPDDTNQQQYYTAVSNRLITVQKAIKDYCAQYNRLLPVINLSQIRLGHEVEHILSNDRRQSSNGNLLATASNSSVLGDPNTTATDLSHPISPPNTAPAPSQGPISVHPNTGPSASGSGANARTPIVLP